MKLKLNQKGLSSILFATIFALILSLLAVGFATLLRNDSRQTLDQTLGYQAQYAAESGVNQAAERIKSTLTEAPSCQNFSLDSASQDVKITCVTWSKAPDIEFSDLTNEPQPFKIDVNGNPGSFIFEWNVTADPAVNGGSGYNVYGSANRLPNNISFNNMPILKAVMIQPGSSKQQIYYFIPTSGGGFGSYGFNGSTYAANCGGSPTTSCTFQLDNVNSSAGGYMAVSVIGRVANDLNIKTASGSFDGIQWQVDSTAIALDITKRVQARVNPSGSTWRPGNVVSAEEICKDIKIDGANNTGISSDNTCALRLDD